MKKLFAMVLSAFMAVAVSSVVVTGAVAQDKKDGMMKKDEMKKDGMMKKDDMMKKDEMKKDAMKKDDMMKK
ncbi:MAG: hypothetical protein H7125_13770 [Proteobacteria bacterium]|nr:hypothetical protein [Burkholderiales bacterium]